MSRRLTTAWASPSTPARRDTVRSLQLVVGSVLLIALASIPAAGQTPMERQALERHIASGRPVNVLLDGQTQPIVGILNAVDGNGIALASDGRVRPVPFTAIGRITRDGDSVWSGAMIGAAVLGSWCAYICGQGLNSGSRGHAVLLGVAWGGAIGALADWSNTGTTTLYRKRSQAAVSTTFTPAGVVLNARLSWR